MAKRILKEEEYGVYKTVYQSDNQMVLNKICLALDEEGIDAEVIQDTVRILVEKNPMNDNYVDEVTDYARQIAQEVETSMRYSNVMEGKRVIKLKESKLREIVKATIMEALR